MFAVLGAQWRGKESEKKAIYSPFKFLQNSVRNPRNCDPF